MTDALWRLQACIDDYSSSRRTEWGNWHCQEKNVLIYREHDDLQIEEEQVLGGRLEYVEHQDPVDMLILLNPHNNPRSFYNYVQYTDEEIQT